MADKPIMHGGDHRPGGMDPSYAGPWHVFGDPGEPDLLAGVRMAPTADVPDPVPSRFRLALGPPNVMDVDAVTIVRYTEHQLEFQLDLSEVSFGDVVFILPPQYQLDHDVAVSGHDDAGNYVACRLLSTGEFIWGVP